MSKWMYKVVDQNKEVEGKIFSKKSVHWIPELNLKELGYDGWELIAVVSIVHSDDGMTTRTQILRHYFKKQIQ